jgi:hypothetical protein
MTAVKIEVQMTFDLGVTFTALCYSQALLTEPEARTQSSTILDREHVVLKEEGYNCPAQQNRTWRRAISQMDAQLKSQARSWPLSSFQALDATHITLGTGENDRWYERRRTTQWVLSTYYLATPMLGTFSSGQKILPSV